MRARYMIYLCLLGTMIGLVASVQPLMAAKSAQDNDIMVSPAVGFFPVTPLGTDSEPVAFAITNGNSTQTRTLGALSLSGPNADQFLMGADTCSGATLAANGSHCSVEVKFHPTRRGTKAANILIPSNDAETPILIAFLCNHEATADEASRRMPPVLQTVDIPEAMYAGAGAPYTLTWTQEGYHDSYTSCVAVFDCTGITDGSCGDNYEDPTRIVTSGNIEPSSVTPGNWAYSGVGTQLFHYSWDFAVPAKRPDNEDWAAEGTQIVVRFYRKSDMEKARESSSISLLIPGNLSNTYYDTAGRRIVKKIYP